MGKTSSSQTHKQAVKKTAKSLSTPKLTPKQIKFCQEVAKGENYTNAAIKAKYSKHTARKQGSRLLTKADIQERVALETQKVQQKFNYTLEQQFNELNDAGEFARKTGNASALLSSVVQKGKLCGLYVDRVAAEVNGSISAFCVNSFLEKFNAEK